MESIKGCFPQPKPVSTLLFRLGGDDESVDGRMPRSSPLVRLGGLSRCDDDDNVAERAHRSSAHKRSCGGDDVGNAAQAQKSFVVLCGGDDRDVEWGFHAPQAL
eukprot:CAMPEP_0171986810 /NCGR_PEP_ID=MMETSP0993-20121228/275058_1 /TAXON_ID=483369 /ORGANISM="non described non described, Strain CCMP2098" /LENGTH=103 /DNA_ID=CAMNT_0012639727 /DNA_START=824 /DNA_END=1135 /DNA_ORIENTATION=-